MDIKLIVLDRLVKWLVGGELFTFIKEAVELMANTNLSGSEKREKVQAMAVEAFSGAVTVLVNLAIEVAVLLLKAKVGELDGN